MRSPLSRGAGRSSALSLAIAMAAISLGGSTALASHHEENEGDQAGGDTGRTVQVALRTDTILVGDRIRADVFICDAGITDLAKCDYAKKAKLVASPKGALKPNQGRGAQVNFRARKPGTVTITATQKGLTGSAELKVNEPPNRDQSKPEDQRLFVTPEEVELAIGQEFVISAASCRMSEGLAGDDGIPITPDDSCTWAETTWNPDPGSGISQVGSAGPGVGLFRVDFFGGSESEERVFAGVQAVTDFGGTLMSGIVRNEAYDGPLLGDTNSDGVRDGADIAHVAPNGLVISDEPIDCEQAKARGLQALDTSGDCVIDEIDAGVFALLEFLDGTGVSRGFVREPTAEERAAVEAAVAKAVEGATADAGQSATAAESLQFLRSIRWSHVDEKSSHRLALALLGEHEAASGDVNGNGVVDVDDYYLAAAIRSNGHYDAAGDMDGDGDVDDDDLRAISVIWNRQQPAGFMD